MARQASKTSPSGEIAPDSFFFSNRVRKVKKKRRYHSPLLAWPGAGTPFSTWSEMALFKMEPPQVAILLKERGGPIYCTWSLSALRAVGHRKKNAPPQSFVLPDTCLRLLPLEGARRKKTRNWVVSAPLSSFSTLSRPWALRSTERLSHRSRCGA